jgi:hypothetical protein
MTGIHTIESTDNLLMQTIKDQASSLEHGWREAVQNAVDSPGSTRVELEFDADKTVVRDDGDGVDLDSEAGLELLKNLGETTKDRGDDSTIGQFGVGKGQIIAKGHAAFISGGTALHFDVNDWGLECKTVPLAQPVDGLEVRVSHYGGEVPPEGSHRWDGFEASIKERFEYVGHTLGVEVAVNGEVVSGGDPRAAETGRPSAAETHTPEGADYGVDIAVGLNTRGGVSVYSNGVKVTDKHGMGISGVVVAHTNMDVDFSRDGIKDGCGVWRAARERLTTVREALIEEAPESELNADARAFVARRMAEDDGARERFAGKRVLRTSHEECVSLEEVRSKERVGFAPDDSQAADRLTEGYGMTVLDEGDAAVAELRADITEGAEVFDPQQKAEQLGLTTVGETVAYGQLNTVREKKLLAAREMASRLGIDRRVRYGESDVAAAWTNGHSEVFITDSAAPSRNRAAWVWELAETLVHEATHTRDTMEGCSHGRSFDRKYRQRWTAAVPAVSEFVTEVEREGLADVVDGVDVVRPDMSDMEWKGGQ